MSPPPVRWIDKETEKVSPQRGSRHWHEVVAEEKFFGGEAPSLPALEIATNSAVNLAHKIHKFGLHYSVDGVTEGSVAPMPVHDVVVYGKTHDVGAPYVIYGNDLVAEQFAEVPEQVAERFAALADTWEAETAFVSSSHDLVLHSAYQSIIGLGLPAVPLILRRLTEQPLQWFWALHHMTGASPAPENSTVEELQQAWLQWGREAGLIA